MRIINIFLYQSLFDIVLRKMELKPKKNVAYTPWWVDITTYFVVYIQYSNLQSVQGFAHKNSNFIYTLHNTMFTSFILYIHIVYTSMFI